MTAPKHQATIILAIDTSRSMTATDVRPNRLTAAKAAARTLVNALPTDGRVGIVGLHATAYMLNTPTDDRSVIRGSLERAHGGRRDGDRRCDRAVDGARPRSATTSDHESTPAARPRRSSCSRTARAPRARSGPLTAAKRAKTAGYTRLHGLRSAPKGGTIKDPATGGLGVRRSGIRARSLKSGEGRRREVVLGTQRDPAAARSTRTSGRRSERSRSSRIWASASSGSRPCSLLGLTRPSLPAVTCWAI